MQVAAQASADLARLSSHTWQNITLLFILNTEKEFRNINWIEKYSDQIILLKTWWQTTPKPSQSILPCFFVQWDELIKHYEDELAELQIQAIYQKVTLLKRLFIQLYSIHFSNDTSCIPLCMKATDQSNSYQKHGY